MGNCNFKDKKDHPDVEEGKIIISNKSGENYKKSFYVPICDR